MALVAVDAAAAPDGSISVPASVIYDGTTYSVTDVGPYAFYLSGATDVALPASIASVDDRVFRSSDVGRVEVDPGNLTYASFDGALYSADKSCLLLIPGGRQGAVRIPDKAEEVDAAAFSHCAGVDAISADAGSATFASWDGLLYDASGTTLLRVPAGATEITIRDGCTAIAAGALEGCAKLEHINAPASVTSISPDVFTFIPTVALPAQSALRDEETSSVASGLPDQVNAFTDFAPQLTAMVALSSTDGDLPETDPAAVAVLLPAGTDAALWRSAGFSVEGDGEDGAGKTDGSDSEDAVPLAAAMVSQDVALTTEGAPVPILANDAAGELSGIPIASLGTASTYAGTRRGFFSTEQMSNSTRTRTKDASGNWGSFSAWSAFKEASVVCVTRG